jgi:hypothetical protein
MPDVTSYFKGTLKKRLDKWPLERALTEELYLNAKRPY